MSKALACDLCKKVVAVEQELVPLLRFDLCVRCLDKPISALKELSDQVAQRIEAELTRLAHDPSQA